MSTGLQPSPALESWVRPPCGRAIAVLVTVISGSESYYVVLNCTTLNIDAAETAMAKKRAGKKQADQGANLGFEAKLWLAADKLRSNMDAAEYKHVVLGLIFLKYISDAFEEMYQKLVAGDGEYAGPFRRDLHKDLTPTTCSPIRRPTIPTGSATARTCSGSTAYQPKATSTSRRCSTSSTN